MKYILYKLIYFRNFLLTIYQRPSGDIHVYSFRRESLKKVLVTKLFLLLQNRSVFLHTHTALEVLKNVCIFDVTIANFEDKVVFDYQ